MTQNILTATTQHWRIQAVAEREAAPPPWKINRGSGAGYFLVHLSKDEAVGAGEWRPAMQSNNLLRIMRCLLPRRALHPVLTHKF
jgi:hypothetical protein